MHKEKYGYQSDTTFQEEESNMNYLWYLAVTSVSIEQVVTGATVLTRSV